MQFPYYLIAVNAIAFLLYGMDKSKAVHHKWRIPEKVLILSAAMGGGAGALIGMLVFHHKTRKPLFFLGVPVILILETALYIWMKTGM